MAKDIKEKHEGNTFVAIGASLAGIFLVIVVIFALLAKEYFVYINSIVWAFVVLGIVLGSYAYKAQKK